MLSMPPTTTTSARPREIQSAARLIVLRPEAQAMFMVHAGLSTGMPARTDTWRAGFGPLPAWRPTPRIVEPTSEGLMPAWASRSVTTETPRSTQLRS